MADSFRLLVAADVDPTNIIGGAERALAGQLDELARRGHRITVLTREQPNRANRETAPGGYNIERYAMPAGMSPVDLTRALLTIRRAADRLIYSEKPDLIYIQQPLAGAGALLSARARRLPSAYQFHSPWSDEFKLRLPRASICATDPGSVKLSAAERVKHGMRRKIEYACVRHVKRVLVLSVFMRDRCRALHPVPENRFAIVPGGVDTKHFCDRADRAAIRARLNIKPQDRVLLTVRNLEPRMGIANLIAAMPAILNAAPEALCIIGGSGPMAEELEAQAAALNLGDRVRFAGFILEPELPEYYASADLFILPTTALEGFGMVTVEALACGTPVSGTPIGATPEILSRLNPDLVLQGIQPEQIAAGCIALINSSSHELESMRARCRTYAVENYSWPAVVNGVELAMQQCMA